MLSMSVSAEAQHQMQGDRGPLEVSLKGVVAASRQMVVAEVELEPLDGSFNHGAKPHDRLEALGHRGGFDVDMGECWERDGHVTSRLIVLLAAVLP